MLDGYKTVNQFISNYSLAAILDHMLRLSGWPIEGRTPTRHAKFLSICAISQRNFTNVLGHASVSCAATFDIGEAWWNTMVDNFKIELSAKLLRSWSSRNLLGFTCSNLFELTFIYFIYLLRDAAALFHRNSRINEWCFIPRMRRFVKKISIRITSFSCVQYVDIRRYFL